MEYTPPNELPLRQEYHRNKNVSMGQMILLALVICVGSLFIATNIGAASFATILVLCFVATLGLLACRHCQITLNDSSLRSLGYYWLIKLVLTIILLKISWMPIINSGTLYDPVRYYYQAQELVENEFIADFLQINYLGIIYYYGFIFYIFGHNPIIPALVNSFITLLACLYLLRVGYEIKGTRETKDSLLALLILLPEVVWFDVLTSRETLMGALLVFSLLTAGRYFLKLKSTALYKVILVNGLSALAIAAVRMSMLLPMALSLILMWILVRPQRTGSRRTQFRALGIGASVLAGGLILSQFVGSEAAGLAESLSAAMSAKDNIASSDEVEYNENSISPLLMPEGIVQAILYLSPRMLLYLLAPLPKFFGPISEALSGDIGSWQVVFTVFSSVINLFAFPYALAGVIHALRVRAERPALLVFHIPYWCTFAAISGGNLIIHERYRVMATLLLAGCVWLGRGTCPSSLLNRVLLFWYGGLTVLSSLYLIYKL